MVSHAISAVVGSQPYYLTQRPHILKCETGRIIPAVKIFSQAVLGDLGETHKTENKDCNVGSSSTDYAHNPLCHPETTGRSYPPNRPVCRQRPPNWARTGGKSVISNATIAKDCTMRTLPSSVPNSVSVRRANVFQIRVCCSSSLWIGLTLLSILTVASAPMASAQCTTGCGDYGQVFAAACDSCTSSCDRLSVAGAGCGCDSGPSYRGGEGALNYISGDSCGCCGSCGGCSECGGSGDGCGYWNSVCGGGGCGGLGGGLLSSRRCRGGGLLARMRGLCGGRCCAGDDGAGDSAVFCGMPAPSYPVPYAVPEHVGYTEFSYSPFMPHHSLPHYRKTYSYQHAPGLSRTNVHWRTTTGWNILARLHNMIELPR